MHLAIKARNLLHSYFYNWIKCEIVFIKIECNLLHNRYEAWNMLIQFNWEPNQLLFLSFLFLFYSNELQEFFFFFFCSLIILYLHFSLEWKCKWIRRFEYFIFIINWTVYSLVCKYQSAYKRQLTLNGLNSNY